MTPKMQPTLRVLTSALVVALLATTSLCAVAQTNPYSTVQTIELAGQEQATYIKKKTDAVFAPPAKPTAQTAAYAVPDGWTQEKLVYGTVPVEKYVSDRTGTTNVLFVHGGGYIGGLHDRYRNWGLHLGDVAEAKTVYELDYRTAPAHPYPAALEDAIVAYEGLLKDGMDPTKTVLIGDSAGGNLAAVLALSLRDKKLPQPKAIVLISPWGDAGAQLPSRSVNYRSDRILGEVNKRLNPEIYFPSYAQGLNKQDPLISPVFADMTGLPDLFITAGGNELLLDDAALLAAHAQRDGVKTTFKIYPGMSHDWTILLPELPASREIEADIRQFVREKLR